MSSADGPAGGVDGDDPDDPIRLRSPFRVRFFTDAMTRRMRRGFSGIRISRSAALPDLAQFDGHALVLYSNHPSWWDPAFMATLVRRAFPDRRAFAPIDHDALQRYGFMRRCGLFGIEPGRAGAARLLETGRRVLALPDAILCITPQGRFSDVREPLALRRGLAALLARAPRVVALPLAFDYPFWDESRPEALARWGAPVRVGGDGRLDARTWQHALTAALDETMTALQREALRRDPSDFVSLLDGTVGVGGVYDAWRRLAAWSSARRFDASHGGRERGGVS